MVNATFLDLTALLVYYCFKMQQHVSHKKRQLEFVCVKVDTKRD